MRAAPNNIIVFISEEDRRKQFEKPITNANGETVWLAIGLPPEDNEDGAGEKSVTVGKVVAVGKNIDWIQEDDGVVIDYMVDMDDKYIISSDDKGKYVSISAVTTTHEDECILDATLRTPHPTVVWKKGDYNEISMLIAIIRDGIVYPNKPYILLAHVEEAMEETESGLFVMKRSVAVERQVVAVYDGCNLEIGAYVTVEDEAIFPREIDGIRMDIVFESDVLMQQESIDNLILNSLS